MVVGGGFEPPKSYDDRFTVCSLWPLGNPTTVWSWRWDSNPQPADYKSAALPVELRQPTEMCFYTRVHGLASIKTPFFEFAFKCFLSIRYVRLIFFQPLRSSPAHLARSPSGLVFLAGGAVPAFCTVVCRWHRPHSPSVFPLFCLPWCWCVLVLARVPFALIGPVLAACRVTVFPTFAPRLGAGHLARSCRGGARLWPSRAPASDHPC